MFILFIYLVCNLWSLCLRYFTLAIYSYMDTHTNKQTNKHIHVHLHTHTRTNTHTHTHTHTHSLTHSLTHTHTHNEETWQKHTDVPAVVDWSFIERKARILKLFSMKVHIHAHISSLFDGGREVEVEVEALWSERSFTVCCANAKCNGTLCLETKQNNILQNTISKLLKQ